MQKDRIFEKASRLGISIDANLNDEDNLINIANKVGLDNFDIDNLNRLENSLDTMISSNNYGEIPNNYESINNDEQTVYSDSSPRFGEREYNAAKDENGVYNKDYYKNRQEELDKKVEEAKEEKEKDTKKTDDEPEKEDGSNTTGKNKFDKLKDDVNLAKARKNQFQNKIDNAKSKIFRATHPEEILKNKAQEIKNDIKDKAKDKVKNIIKKDKKEETKKAVGKVLLKNPKVRIAIIIGAGVLLLFLILLLAAGNINNKKVCTYECEHFSIKETTLSRKEFIEKVQNYYSGRNGTAAKNFYEYAGDIYDIATNENVNPEMVVVRAIAEGYSPGSSYNNYWGMGSYNESGGGLKYSSFLNGVKGFVKNISKYDTVTNMMLKYSYIGRYWFNPGNSGLGGCYYFPHIREYMSEQRAREVEKICNSGILCTREDKSNCVETTEEDQKAKATRSVVKMENIRKDVFGLEPGVCAEVCKDDGKNVNQEGIIYKQGDPAWGYIHLGRSNTTMARSGCAVTSIAIGISFSGTQVSTATFDAGVFINALNAGNCFTGSGLIKWACGAISEVAPAVHYAGRETLNGDNSSKIYVINQYPIDKYILLAHFSNKYHTRGHYVNFQEFKNNNEYIARDPASGSLTTEQISEIDSLIIYSY